MEFWIKNLALKFGVIMTSYRGCTPTLKGQNATFLHISKPLRFWVTKPV